MDTILYMAPIRGITNHIYRNMYSRSFDGYDRCVTPFLKSSKGKQSTLKDILPARNDVTFDIIPQILEKDPESFISQAKGMYDMGYKTVNWNLGCPLPMIRKKMRGSGLLPFPEEIVSFLEEVVPNVKAGISIKVRLGAEEKTDLAKLLPMLDNVPLEEVIIHPRTGKQMYKGESDILSFEDALSLTRHTVVYNGDINSVNNFRSLSEKFPRVDRWMIGRGGIIDPFLPERIKDLRNENEREELDRMKAFHDAMFRGYQAELSGASHVIGKMKENWRYWAMGFEGGARFFVHMSRARSLERYSAVVDRFFKKGPKRIKV